MGDVTRRQAFFLKEIDRKLPEEIENVQLTKHSRSAFYDSCGNTNTVSLHVLLFVGSCVTQRIQVWLESNPSDLAR